MNWSAFLIGLSMAIPLGWWLKPTWMGSIGIATVTQTLALILVKVSA